MTYYGLPDDKWKDNPWIPGKNNLDDIGRINLAIAGGAWANKLVAEKAQFMRPEQAAMFNRWAMAHPTVNPRTWAPLAKAGIDPYSEAGSSVASADITMAAYQGTYDKFLGQKGIEGEPPPQSVTPEEDNPWGPDWLWDVGGAAAGVVSTTAEYANPITLLKAQITGISSGYQGMWGAVRESLGNNAEIEAFKDKIAKRSGLSDTEVNEVEDFFQSGGEIGSTQIAPGVYVDPVAAAQGLDSDDPEAIKQRFYGQFGARENVDTMWQAYQAFQEGRAAIIGEPSDYAKSVALQTDAGVMYRSFTDGVEGNYLTGRPADGSKFDPKTQTWLNPETGEPAAWVDHRGIFMPHEALIETQDAAIRAYDIRTAEERKNGVAPVAWTLGRGVAHRFYSADETAFYTWSGVIDFASSLFADPANLIPVGAAVKAAKGGTLAARAFAGKGDDLVIAARGFQFGAGGVRLPSAVDQARTGAVLAARRGLDTPLPGGKPRLMELDPQMLDKGNLIEDLGGRSKVVRLGGETGLVNVPHVKYVVKSEAWRWLNSAKGQRVVNDLTERTDAYEIWNRTNQQIDMDLAIKLADARTPEEVRAILGTRIGYDLESARQLGNLGGVSPVIGRTPLLGDTLTRGFGVSGKELEGSGLFTSAGRSAFARMQAEHGFIGASRSLYRSPFRVAPSSGVGFSLNDTTSIAEEMSRFFRGIRAPEDKISATINQLVRAPNPAVRYRLIYGDDGILDAVAKDLVAEKGMSESYAHKITRAFAGGLNEDERIFTNSIGRAAYGAKDEGGTQGRALLLDEMLSSQAYLPDYRTLRRATGILAKIDKLPITDLEKTARINDALVTITSAWRDLVLMRPAYILREVGEMAFSMSLAGGEGMFTHPFAFLANAMQASLAMHMQTHMGRAMARAVGTPLKGAKYVTQNAGRLLIPSDRERAAWRTYASLPDEERPDFMRGLNAPEIDELYRSMTPQMRDRVFWDSIDREAMKEYLMLHEGAQWLFPSVNSKWARLNGKPMFDELWRIADGEEVAVPRFQYELNHTTGNLVIDEPAVRGAARHVRPLNRNDVHHRTAYAKALIDHHLAPIRHDSLMRKLADPRLSDDQIIADWRGTEDWLLRRQMRPELWGNRNDLNQPVTFDTVSLEDDIEYVLGYRQMLQNITGQDGDLLTAVMKGTFGPKEKAINAKNQSLVNHVVGLLDDEDARKMFPEILHDIPYKGSLAGQYRRFTNGFFMGTGDFSDLFARAPMVRQFWADRIIEMADDLSPSARMTAAANLRRAHDYSLAKKVLRSGSAKKGMPGQKVGTLTIEEADAIASGYARRMMAKTFYNAHRRQNYAVAWRTVMPFIQATMNTFKRWGAMSLMNPQLAYRTLKPIEALRDPGSAVLYELLGEISGDDAMSAMYSPGHPEASVDGFFFQNQYGDRMFAFPGVRNAYNLLPGKDLPEGAVPLAPANNLNVAGTTFNPGFGPLVTLPATFLYETEIYQDDALGKVLRAAFPYGLSDSPDWLTKIIDSVAPTAFRRALMSPDEQANMAAKMIPSLMATGEYELDKQGEIRRLIGDASALTGRLNRFSAITGAVTPTTFNWNYMIDVSDGDKDGAVRHFMLQDRLAQEWRKYTAPKSDVTANDDYNNGALRFLKDYGLFAFYSVQPRTEQVDAPIATTPTADVWSFRTENPDAYEKHRGVIAIFFPGGDPVGEWGTAEENLYRWQKVSGERRTKSEEDFMMDANQALGWILYGAATRNLALTVTDPELQTALRARLADEVAEKFPGWTDDPMDSGKYKRAMNEVREATLDEDIQTLPGTPYIAAYMEARDDAVEGLRQQGTSGDLSASYAAIERANLAAFAGRLAAEDSSGTFAYAWARLFSQELEVE